MPAQRNQSDSFFFFCPSWEGYKSHNMDQACLTYEEYYSNYMFCNLFDIVTFTFFVLVLKANLRFKLQFEIWNYVKSKGLA